MLATVAWSAAANRPSGLRTRPRCRTCAYSGLQIEKRLAPSLVTPEVFERAFGLLAGLYQEQ